MCCLYIKKEKTNTKCTVTELGWYRRPTPFYKKRASPAPDQGNFHHQRANEERVHAGECLA